MTMRRKKWHIEDAIPNLEKATFIRIFKSQIRFNTAVLYDTAYALFYRKHSNRNSVSGFIRFEPV